MVSLLDKVPGRALAQRDRTVRVNGVVIPRGAIAQEAQHHAAPSPAQAWTQAARALVVRELLLQEARRIGIVAEPQEDGEGRRETDEEALVRMLLAQEVRTPEPGEDECRRVFASRLGVFSSKVLYETRHILIPVRGEEERCGARTGGTARTSPSP